MYLALIGVVSAACQPTRDKTCSNIQTLRSLERSTFFGTAASRHGDNEGGWRSFTAFGVALAGHSSERQAFDPVIAGNTGQPVKTTLMLCGYSIGRRPGARQFYQTYCNSQCKFPSFLYYVLCATTLPCLECINVFFLFTGVKLKHLTTD